MDATRSIDAGLEDPLAAVLTVARSFDRITYANVTMPPGHELEIGILRPAARGEGAAEGLTVVRSWAMSSALDCVDRSSPRLDQLAAYEVAWWFLAAPRDGRDPLVVCAYAELQAQTDRLFAELTDLDNPLGVRVSFTTCQAPYASAEELITPSARNVS